MNLPFAGLRVLDLSRALAGPFCTQMLSDMGATIIKVEQPGAGDHSRGWGPPFQGGESSYFLSVNRNKQSIAVNLRNAAGAEVIRRLAASCAIVVENFVPGALDRMGLGYEDLRLVKPDIIYCAISGFGPLGPDRERPAYDQIAQGEGGLMSLIGEDGEPPVRVGIAITDLMAGMFAAYAIAAAVTHHQCTGQGQRVDTSLLEGQLAMLTYQAGSFFATGHAPQRTGNRHPSIHPYGVYRTADGYFNLAVGTEALWQRFCAALALDALRDDPRFATNPQRSQHRRDLDTLLDAVFAQHTSAGIAQILRDAGVPCGAVRDIAQVFGDAQTQALGIVQHYDHPTAGAVQVVGPPYRLSEHAPRPPEPAPLLGQHTDAILAELGYDPDAILALRTMGAVG